MFPLGFVLGAMSATAAGALMLSPQVMSHARPVAKALLKVALAAMHEAQLRGAEVSEAAEDLFAEAKAEAAAETFATTMAMAQEKAAAAAKPASKKTSPTEGNGATGRATTSAARKTAEVRQSRTSTMSPKNG